MNAKQKAYRKWYKTNPEKAKTATYSWIKRNKGRFKAYCDKRVRSEYFKHQFRMTRYGLTKKAFLGLITGQKNKCLICREEFKGTPHVDHCHKTGKVRGLLCRHCNALLGYAKENVKTLLSAAKYLRGFK